MKSLYKKIGAIALAGMMLSGGFAVSGIKAYADSSSGQVYGHVDKGGRMRRRIIDQIHQYNVKYQGVSEIDFMGYYHSSSSEFKDIKFYRFGFVDILDFIDYLEQNYAGKNNKNAGVYKVRLDAENAVIVVHFR